MSYRVGADQASCHEDCVGLPTAVSLRDYGQRRNDAAVLVAMLFILTHGCTLNYSPEGVCEVNCAGPPG